MIQRLAAALVLCMSLASCNKEDVPPVATLLFQGQGNVKVLDARIVPTGDASAATSGGTLGYVIARVEFTNDTGLVITPAIDHFYLLDRQNFRYQAKDSGSSVFIGVSNSQQPLAVNAKREYTIGFRTADPSVSGTIFYER
jgi:hypothetical protein